MIVHFERPQVGEMWKRQRGRGAWNRGELLRWLIENGKDWRFDLPDDWRDAIDDRYALFFAPIYFLDGTG